MQASRKMCLKLLSDPAIDSVSKMHSVLKKKEELCTFDKSMAFHLDWLEEHGEDRYKREFENRIMNSLPAGNSAPSGCQEACVRIELLPIESLSPQRTDVNGVGTGVFSLSDRAVFPERRPSTHHLQNLTVVACVVNRYDGRAGMGEGASGGAEQMNSNSLTGDRQVGQPSKLRVCPHGFSRQPSIPRDDFEGGSGPEELQPA